MKTIMQKNWELILLIFLFLYLLLISLQSVTFTDEGFYLSSYQTFFPDPASNGYFFMYYLTMLIGGVWEYVAGWGGMLSFRILNSLVILICVYVIISSFKGMESKKTPLVLASFFTVVFISFSITSFSYNTLSLLLACLLFYVLNDYYFSGTVSSLFFAGFLVGLSIFTRIPNILFFLIPIPLLILKKVKMTSWIFLIVGFWVGVITVWAIIIFLGHSTLFIQVLHDIFVLGGSNESSHGLFQMVGVYLNNIRDIIAIMVPCFAVYYAFERKKTVSAFLFAVTMCYWSMVLVGIFFRPGLYGVIYGVLYFAVIIYWNSNPLSTNLRTRKLAIQSYLGVAFTIIYPIGSDHGIYNVANISTFWLCYVVCVMWLNVEIRSFSYYVAIIGILASIVIVLNRVIFSPSFSGVSRFKSNAMINESPLSNIYTTQEIVVELNGLLKSIKKYSKEGDYVLCYPNIPMINYLSETRPYLYNCWPKLYTRDLLKMYLEKALAERQELPLVVRQKCLFEDDKYQMLTQFIINKKYTTVFSNSNYEVLVPHSPLTK